MHELGTGIGRGRLIAVKPERMQAQILHKAAVKKKYSRVLKGYKDDTPEFYKEIFAQVDEEQQAEREKNRNGSRMSGRRSGGEVDDTAEYNSSDLNDDNDDNDGSHHSSANLSKNKRERIHKPNPMRRAQQQMEEQQRELEAIRQKERMAREQQLKEIAEKKKQRGKARKRMMVKTRTGQPAMAGRIANMLDQLKAEARSE